MAGATIAARRRTSLASWACCPSQVRPALPRPWNPLYPLSVSRITSTGHHGSDGRPAGSRGPGTLAEYIAVPVDQIYEKPAHLSLVEAAALPLAGLTAYRYRARAVVAGCSRRLIHSRPANQVPWARPTTASATVTKANVKAGQRILVTGIGMDALHGSGST